MVLPVDSALSVLVDAGRARDVDVRLFDRLEAVQRSIADDLGWVEAELRIAVEQGPSPATKAASHLVRLGGKRIRPLALLLSSACFGPISKPARELAVVTELVHSATLLHDDVVDEGTERRGAPTARRLWGNGVSVLAGDLLLVHALDRTLIHAPQLMAELVTTLRRLVDGELVQLRGRTELDVSQTTYEQVLRDKTASLFEFAARAGARLAGASRAAEERMVSFGEQLGVAFQLVDDVLDYSLDGNKTLFGDLREGKLTLPLVLAVLRRPELVEPLTRIHAGDEQPVAFVSRAVIDSGVCDEVRRRARHHTEAAVEALRGLEPTRARDLLESAAWHLAARAV